MERTASNAQIIVSLALKHPVKYAKMAITFLVLSAFNVNLYVNNVIVINVSLVQPNTIHKVKNA